MAHHGGLAHETSASLQQPSSVPPPRPPVPRVHRPRMAIMTPPPPTTIILQPLGSTTTTPASPVRRQPPPAEVTLTAPRPDGDRAVNEYVETPFRPAAASEQRRDPPHHQALHLPIHNPAKKKPVTFKKDTPGSSSSGGDAGTSGGDCFRGSIICPECGRCRCESCRQPRPLPSRWLCVTISASVLRRRVSTMPRVCAVSRASSITVPRTTNWTTTTVLLLGWTTRVRADHIVCSRGGGVLPRSPSSYPVSGAIGPLKGVWKCARSATRGIVVKDADANLVGIPSSPT
ncbi:hypothetical protein L9F63_001800 [Diploptera punctata]|uniref:Uncharacterized protein n=1 Tax=Diploptera punctata TaxID=6984 RepID=A0AAD8EIC0_DIPPU|nr:hypothetical protein L9F63_001800 [Diploptera punctata]